MTNIYWTHNGLHQHLVESLEGLKDPTYNNLACLYYDHYNNGHQWGVVNTYIVQDAMNDEKIARIVSESGNEKAIAYLTAIRTGWEECYELEGDEDLWYEAQELDEDDSDHDSEYDRLMEEWEDSRNWYIEPVGCSADAGLEALANVVILAIAKENGLVD